MPGIRPELSCSRTAYTLGTPPSSVCTLARFRAGFFSASSVGCQDNQYFSSSTPKYPSLNRSSHQATRKSLLLTYIMHTCGFGLQVAAGGHSFRTWSQHYELYNLMLVEVPLLPACAKLGFWGVSPERFNLSGCLSILREINASHYYFVPW